MFAGPTWDHKCSPTVLSYYNLRPYFAPKIHFFMFQGTSEYFPALLPYYSVVPFVSIF